MFYSEILKRSYLTDKARANAEKRSSASLARNHIRNSTPRITEPSSSWIGTPTPEDVPPWGDVIPKEATYVKDYELAPLA